VGLSKLEELGWSISPNPCSATTTISIESHTNESVSVALFDDLGQIVSRVYDGLLQSGLNRFDLDLANRPSGVYFVRMVTPGQTATGSVLKFE
jgi:hypothetical protein